MKKFKVVSVGLFLFIIIVSLFEIATKSFSQRIYSKGEIDAALVSSWTGYKTYYINNGRVIRPDQGNDTVSEGQGYAMVRAVYMNDQQTFDSIWHWTKQNLSRQNNNDSQNQDNLFAWHYANNQVSDWSSATDADEDIAKGLLFASSRWKNNAYLAEGQSVISSILANDTVKGSDNRLYITGGSFGRFQQNVDIDPSYLAPADYKIFASVSGDTRWNDVVTTSYYLLNKSVTESVHSNSGLFPNWVLFNPTDLSVTANTHQDRNLDYTYDAFRTPYRLAEDALWYGDNRAVNLLSGNLNDFFVNQWNINGQKIYAEYDHNGSPKATYESSAIYGGNVGVFMVTHNAQMISQIINKIMGDYNQNYGNGYFGNVNTNYYGNNWAWFGLLLSNNEDTNIFVSPSSNTIEGIGVPPITPTPSASLISGLTAPSGLVVGGAGNNAVSAVIQNVQQLRVENINLTVNTSSVTSPLYLVDTEFKDKNGTKVGQIIMPALTQKGNATPVSISWQVPTNIPSGNYTIDVGVFSTDWKQQFIWGNAIGSVNIN